MLMGTFQINWKLKRMLQQYLQMFQKIFLDCSNYWRHETKYKLVQMRQNGPSKICGRQPLKNLKEYGLLKQAGQTPLNFLKVIFHKFYLVHSWILEFLGLSWEFFTKVFHFCKLIILIPYLLDNSPG